MHEALGSIPALQKEKTTDATEQANNKQAKKKKNPTRAKQVKAVRPL
jgi:hypothetical protein